MLPAKSLGECGGAQHLVHPAQQHIRTEWLPQKGVADLQDRLLIHRFGRVPGRGLGVLLLPLGSTLPPAVARPPRALRSIAISRGYRAQELARDECRLPNSLLAA